MQLSTVITVLETLAPPNLAEPWDNTGLLLGDRDADVTRVQTCLTLTPDVAVEAAAAGAQLVVAHHPLMFKPVQRLTADTVEGRSLLTLARHGVAVYSPHTAWDSAPAGINQQLAELLELSDTTPLRQNVSESAVTIVTFVPQNDLEPVQRALWDAGCGVIGEYRECSFYVAGTGTFHGGENSNPTVGVAGQLEHAAEYKLEVVCPKQRLPAALRALRAAHSYEQPAIDVVPLEPLPVNAGAGRVGRLPAPVTLEQLVQRLQSRLTCLGLQVVGVPDMKIEKVGVACGSAAEFWQDAQRAGCQVLVTGEARFHSALEVREAGLALIVAGHFATERFAMERLAVLLGQRCPELSVTPSAVERDPFWSPIEIGS